MLPKPKRIVDQDVLETVRGLPCCVCGRMGVDPSHIRTRGSGGPDTPWNVVPHCRLHHTEWGQSWSKFLRKYPPMAFMLRKMGWEWADGKLWHPGLSSGGF